MGQHVPHGRVGLPASSGGLKKAVLSLPTGLPNVPLKNLRTPAPLLKPLFEGLVGRHESLGRHGAQRNIVQRAQFKQHFRPYWRLCNVVLYLRHFVPVTDTTATFETMILSPTKSSWFAPALMFFTLALCAVPEASSQIREEEEVEPVLISEDALNQLLMWFVDEKYEKVLFKAIRYTEDDKQKKHPVPYLYMAKSYLGIHNSDDNDLRETYEVDKLKALKNALKYAGKFVKKDKEQEYVPSEQDFFEELRLETIIAQKPKWTTANSPRPNPTTSTSPPWTKKTPGRG